MSKKNIVFVIMFLCFCFMVPIRSQAAIAPPEVETIVIPGFSDSIKKGFTMQPTPKSVASILNFVDKTTNQSAKQLLKYTYPTYSEVQLNSVTANIDQSNKYTLSKGYKTKILNGVPSVDLLKEEFSNNRPILAYLNANGSYWIEQETSIILYGYQKITFSGQKPMILYMYSSVIHGNGVIYSGGENEIPLLLNESYIDPTANVTFKWVSTLYGFKK